MPVAFVIIGVHPLGNGDSRNAIPRGGRCGY